MNTTTPQTYAAASAPARPQLTTVSAAEAAWRTGLAATADGAVAALRRRAPAALRPGPGGKVAVVLDVLTRPADTAQTYSALTAALADTVVLERGQLD